MSLTRKSCESQENFSCVHSFGIIWKACCICERVASGSMLKTRHSGMVLRAMPSWMRPPLRWSRNAERSAMRMRWLKRAGASAAEWPTWMFLVPIAMAVSMTSGAEL